MILAMGTKANTAQDSKEQVILQVCSSVNPHKTKPTGRCMQVIPLLYMEGNKLSFDETGQPFTLYLYSGNTLVYYQDVQGDVNQVELPANLKGEFCLMLVYNDIAYSGEITLN